MARADPSGNQNADSLAFRATLRRERLAARLALTPEDRQRSSAAIEALLAARLLAGPPRSLAFCWPMRNEFDCRPLVLRLLAAGWRASQPVVVAPAAPMVFRPWTPATPMATDRHGIPVPAGNGVDVPDVVLLPLVAFDSAGYRLGYGGGFFDRTLAAMSPRPVAIGVGFELARTDSVHPQGHDQRLDAIVTEAGWRDVVSA